MYGRLCRRHALTVNFGPRTATVACGCRRESAGPHVAAHAGFFIGHRSTLLKVSQKPQRASVEAAVSMIAGAGTAEDRVKVSSKKRITCIGVGRPSIARLNVVPFTDKSGFANRVADRSRQ